jgi:hypothetical protein
MTQTPHLGEERDRPPVPGKNSFSWAGGYFITQTPHFVRPFQRAPLCGVMELQSTTVTSVAHSRGPRVGGEWIAFMGQT